MFCMFLKKLSSRGFEAYIVGGCVRDIMLQKIPSDFDITTNALSFEIKKSALKNTR